jgi:hypothetical protein
MENMLRMSDNSVIMTGIKSTFGESDGRKGKWTDDSLIIIVYKLGISKLYSLAVVPKVHRRQIKVLLIEMKLLCLQG